MKVLNSSLQDDIINKTFREFSGFCLIPDVGTRAAKDSFLYAKDLFIHEKRIEEFCSKTFELSEKLNNKGKISVSMMLINELGKLCQNFRLYEQAEIFLNMAIENSQKRKDGLHELARLVDLENMYKTLNDRKKLFDVLKRKKECCKKILCNYDENVSNFRSINIKPTSKESVQIQLAFTYSTLAEMLRRRKPKDTFALYQKAKQIYEELDRTKEVAYLEEKLKRLNNQT